jgi:hypothetical protein
MFIIYIKKKKGWEGAFCDRIRKANKYIQIVYLSKENVCVLPSILAIFF